jgi:hypothetical protein
LREYKLNRDLSGHADGRSGKAVQAAFGAADSDLTMKTSRNVKSVALTRRRERPQRVE